MRTHLAIERLYAESTRQRGDHLVDGFLADARLRSQRWSSDNDHRG